MPREHEAAQAISKVGQNHIYTVYIRCFWQGNHQIYSIYTVLANPSYKLLYCVYSCLVLKSSLYRDVNPSQGQHVAPEFLHIQAMVIWSAGVQAEDITCNMGVESA